ncbi:hypothetical protein [Nitrosomonas oligotropha]|uniref:Uncharacterized protein n=1 Tax=Nitrosomonas oligotropha TaxID=42354 RepID=A0A1H8PVQ4_9PROT|nr:hypothetical protein [Nitrosomonas oligotropha]SDW65600.1 hypothetical protein SAMN05216300_10828 [Nitrosomonas oligotropha]SEO45623.1 hypothetical protein SAMN05216333_11028 [Nitrosomonas oligotropha]
MISKKTFLLLSAWLMVLTGFIGQAWATHISQPILTDPKTHYAAGETVILHGRVDYNEQPAPDVLLNFKLTRADGSVAADQSYPSDQNGLFEFKFDTRNEKAGSYQFTVTSHCLEIHRYACTYKNQTLSIQLQ